MQDGELAVPPRDDPAGRERPVRSELVDLDEVQLKVLAVRLADGRSRDRDIRPPRYELVAFGLELILALLEREGARLAPEALA